MSKKTKKGKMDSYLIFELDNELFAIHVNKVLSILEMKKITKVPETPDYMKGVINLRGEVLPIIDSHIKFNMPPMSVSMKTSILVMELKHENAKTIKLGLMVDKVDEVLQIQTKKIQAPPSIGAAYESTYITGMYKKDDKNFIMLIDIDKVLSLKEIVTMGDIGKLKEEMEKEEEEIIEADEEKVEKTEE
ncbi:MAG: chemotaxis protein CheW [Bacteroidetes bacterium]|nr:MAG: chemotaxis protein CheW [Bacteroidota bacterium]